MKELFSRFSRKSGKGGNLYLAFVLALGVLLMFLGGFGSGAGKAVKKDGDGAAAAVEAPAAGGGRSAGYESVLEEKLEETLSLVSGAGRVRVLLSVSTRDETSYAQDVTYESSTESAEGGRGAQSEKRELKHVVLTDKDGHSAPIVTKRSEPKIEGAVIVAEGGGSAEIRAALSRAAEALLNLPAHKIEVLKMDTRK